MHLRERVKRTRVRDRRTEHKRDNVRYVFRIPSVSIYSRKYIVIFMAVQNWRPKTKDLEIGGAQIAQQINGLY